MSDPAGVMTAPRTMDDVLGAAPDLPGYPGHEIHRAGSGGRAHAA